MLTGSVLICARCAPFPSTTHRLYNAPSVLEGHSLTTLTPVFSEEVINSQVRNECGSVAWKVTDANIPTPVHSEEVINSQFSTGMGPIEWWLEYSTLGVHSPDTFFSQEVINSQVITNTCS